MSLEPSVAWIGDGVIPWFKSEDFGFARIFEAEFPEAI